MSKLNLMFKIFFVGFILVVTVTSLTSCSLGSSTISSESNSSAQADPNQSETSSTDSDESTSGTKSDVTACSSVKIAFEDLFVMSESGQYSPAELNQQRILAYESGLLSAESERLYSLMDFLRSWNINPVGLSVNEYREMQSICESLGVSF